MRSNHINWRGDKTIDVLPSIFFLNHNMCDSQERWYWLNSLL